jgi:hypothetical protein
LSILLGHYSEREESVEERYEMRVPEQGASLLFLVVGDLPSLVVGDLPSLVVGDLQVQPGEGGESILSPCFVDALARAKENQREFLLHWKALLREAPVSLPCFVDALARAEENQREFLLHRKVLLQTVVALSTFPHQYRQ